MDKDFSMTKKIGRICVITYFFSYVLRNVLSVATPAMIKENFFTKEYIGLLSSAYFIFYAVGQLINGFIGDMVRPIERVKLINTKTVAAAWTLLCGAGRTL